MKTRGSWRSRWWALAVILVALLAARAALPVAIQRYVNDTLDRIPEYDGRIGDVDLHLWRGAYEIEDVSLVKVTESVPVPLFAAPRVDLSIEWGALLRGALVGEIFLESPDLNFVHAPSPEGTQTGVDASWIARVKDLFPLRLDRVEIRHGAIRYHDFHSDPRVDVEMSDVDGVAVNLTNRPSPDKKLPASVHATGQPPGGGTFVLEGRLDPLAARPTFTLDVSLEGVALPSLNEFLRAYANVDAEGGTFSAYAELAAEAGRFEGYVKPLFKDVQVARWREDESFLRRLWEGIVQVAAKVLENPEKERVATRIPLRGRFEEPSPDIWAAIGGLLRNAFVQAFLPGIEGSIDLPSSDREGKGSRPLHPQP